MIGLKILGIICLALLCFMIPIELVIDVYKKPRPTKIAKDGKRELKINRISHWDYLIIIIPLSLLLIGILTNDHEEKLTSFEILGIGYTFFLLSPYNNRIDIVWVNRTIVITCLILSFVAYYLHSLGDYSYETQSGSNCLTTLYFPLATYIYLMIVRRIIKLTTNTYPLTLDKYFRVGHFSRRYNRKATYLDLIWSVWNFIGFPFIMFYIFK